MPLWRDRGDRPGLLGGRAGVITGATGVMTGKTGVVAGPGCSGSREPDDQACQ